MIVVDGFYHHPQEVRQLLLDLPHPVWKRHPKESKNFVEYQDCRACLDPFWYGYSERVARFVELEWGLKLRIPHPIVTNYFRALSPHSPLSVPHPHSDLCNVIATVIYLNIPEECSGGTAFYRNRQLGLFNASDDPDKYRDQVSQIHTGDNTEDGRDYFLSGWERYWECIDLVPMAFNRAVIYPGIYFHSAWHEPDTWLSMPRLNQVLFQPVLDPARNWFSKVAKRYQDI